jgi:hypothetical protein
MIDVLPTWAPPRKATRYDFSGTEVSSAALRISATVRLADFSGIYEKVAEIYGSYFFCHQLKTAQIIQKELKMLVI